MRLHDNHAMVNHTDDIDCEEAVTFRDLLLRDKIIQGLEEAGFVKPSPIQLKAVPVGKFGNDMIVQAKSGTGKTCVFGVIALEKVDETSLNTQVLILAPTREVAVQICAVIKKIGVQLDGLTCDTFIGGIPTNTDKVALSGGCHIAVGTPGRVKSLFQQGILQSDAIRLFIMDEADRLMEDSFYDDIVFIFQTLPKRKQVIGLSATFTDELVSSLEKFMRSPLSVRVCGLEAEEAERQSQTHLWLEGVKQFYCVIEPPCNTTNRLGAEMMRSKVQRLLEILGEIPFDQCIVFCNQKPAAEALAEALNRSNWPAVCITGSQTQTTRLEAMRRFQQHDVRVITSTDLISRGIDNKHANLVVNLDIPTDPATYIHRVGRAGRFGAYGIAITFIAASDVPLIQSLGTLFNMNIDLLLDTLPPDALPISSSQPIDELARVLTKESGIDGGNMYEHPYRAPPARVAKLEEAGHQGGMEEARSEATPSFRMIATARSSNDDSNTGSTSSLVVGDTIAAMHSLDDVVSHDPICKTTSVTEIIKATGDVKAGSLVLQENDLFWKKQDERDFGDASARFQHEESCYRRWIEDIGDYMENSYRHS